MWGDVLKIIDLTNQRFGKLTVLKMIYDKDRQKYSHCECVCDCGKIVIKSSYQLRHARQEPSCGCNNHEYMIKRFSKDIDGKKFNRLTVLETFWNENPRPKVKCLCDCGNIILLNRNDVMSGHTKSCGCLQRETMRNIRNVDNSNYVSDFNIKILFPYKRNNKGQLIWECECGYCGNHFYELPARIKNNHVRSCGCLISSSMEKYISNFLKSKNILFETQYTFDDCKNEKRNKLRFDFAILKNGKVYYLIEYDGEQHFKSVKYFGGDDGLKCRQTYDTIKNEYCKLHNIPLLRLSYYFSNAEIENEITNILNP